jgi:peptide/nickel transport system substrate-binding protein
MVILVAVLLGACGGTEGGGGAGGSDRLIIADQSTPVALDPTLYSGEPMIESVYNVYAPLLRYKPTQVAKGIQGDNIHASAEEDLEGWLAKSWQRVAPTRLRFELRKGVKSAAGNELTSADVTYTVERNQKLNLVGAQGLRQGKITGAKAVDRYTVDITTSVPSQPAPFIAALPLSLGILDSKEVKTHATSDDPWATEWLKLHTAGFGPYQLKDATPGQKFTFVTNPNYFERQPDFKTVEWREVGSASDRVSLLRSGEIDIANTIPPQLRKDLRQADNVRVVDIGKQWSMLTLGLTPNFKHEPLNKREVRQAIAYLLPNDEILEKIYQGEGTIRKSWVAPGLTGATEANWHYEENVDKAKKLLAEAGLPDGFKTSIDFDSSQATHEQIASLIRSALARGGIDVQLNKLSPTKYFDSLSKRTFDILMTYGGPLIPNAAYELDLWYDRKNFINSGSYDSPEVEEFITQAVQAPTTAAYAKAIQGADAVLAEDLPRIGVTNEGDHYQFSTRLKGFFWRANTQHYDWAKFHR